MILDSKGAVFGRSAQTAYLISRSICEIGAAYFFMFLIISAKIISIIILKIIFKSKSIINTPFSVGVGTAAAAPPIKVNS